MPRRCTICAHDGRAAIETALLRGEPYRAIARRFETSDDALRQHLAGHLVEKLAKAETIDAGTLLRKIGEAEEAARRLLRRAEREGELTAAVSAVRALSDVLKLTGAALVARQAAGPCLRCEGQGELERMDLAQREARYAELWAEELAISPERACPCGRPGAMLPPTPPPMPPPRLLPAPEGQEP